ncbi:MAG: transposase [Gemmatimonadetes bacterium]|nr:transposase [Gemmatimonadota bacterium]
MENCFIESYGADECPASTTSPRWAGRHRIEQWRQEYNTERPHSSLGNSTPAEYAPPPPRGGTPQP